MNDWDDLCSRNTASGLLVDFSCDLLDKLSEDGIVQQNLSEKIPFNYVVKLVQEFLKEREKSFLKRYGNER